MMMSFVSFVTPWACASREGQRPGVPPNANVAVTQIQTAVRSALANGKRRLCVDLLLSAVDSRARTYDEGSAEAVFNGLISSIQPVLPVENSKLQIVVHGSTTALRVRKWLQQQPDLKHISVTLLGADAISAVGSSLAQSEDSSSVACGALLVLNPPGTGNSITDLRTLLQMAHDRNIPVVVQNHPREGSVYELLGYGGTIPFEMWQYEPAFVLAPFAISPRNLDDQIAVNTPPARFVLMRQFPSKWSLWHFMGQRSDASTIGDDIIQDYHLCDEFNERPVDEIIIQCIGQRMSTL